MPARLLALWSCSLFSAMGGSLYLHLQRLGCGHGGSAAKKAAEMQGPPDFGVPPMGSFYPSGDAVDCSKLLLQHADHDRITPNLDQDTMPTPDHDLVWSELLREAPFQSIFLDAGSNVSSLPMNLLVDSGKEFRVRLFQPQLSKQLEACAFLSRRKGELHMVQIYPVQAGEREDIMLPSRQLQTSFDTYANDRGWFGPNDDTQQTLNGAASLRGSLGKSIKYPLVQALTISSDDAYRNFRILQGAIELLNRHYVRNVLVTFTFSSDRSANEDRESLRRGMQVLDHAGYHVHKTIDRSSDAGHQLTVWWKL